MEFLGIRLIGFNEDTLTKLALTAAIVGAVLILRKLVATTTTLSSHRATRRSVWMRKGVRLAFGIVAVLLLFSVWFDRPERLATFTGLLVAGAAVASQKAILSFAGYFVIVFGKVFDIGDRIQIGDVRGDVLDIGLFKTTVMEMGVPPSLLPDPNNWITSRQYTGRVVTFTNSEVFESATFNYSRMFDFLWEEMRIPLHYEEDLERAEAIALAAARGATVHVVEDARRQLERVRQRFPLQPADLEPQSYLRLTDDWVELSVRFLVRAWGIRAAKDEITRSVLRRYREEGISIASATFEVVKLPELRIRADAGLGAADRDRERPAAH
jgi:small-conductance mechanosensitive channel